MLAMGERRRDEQKIESYPTDPVNCPMGRISKQRGTPALKGGNASRGTFESPDREMHLRKSDSGVEKLGSFPEKSRMIM